MTRSLRTVRRTAAVLGVVAAPLAFAASFGVASAEATPWRIGPLYRAETSGESAEYVCNKALAMEKSSRAVVLEPCTYEPLRTSGTEWSSLPAPSASEAAADPPPGVSAGVRLERVRR